MTFKEAGQKLVQDLGHLYDRREAITIADWVMEHLTSRKKIDRLADNKSVLTPEQIRVLTHYTNELMLHRPVQYVLQEAWFCGMKLYVDENVLIPRPETEELVEWIATDLRSMPANSPCRILDVGTGSGCIAIALKQQFPSAEVFGCDISSAALKIASRNAKSQDAVIGFMQIDFLVESSLQPLHTYDIIVSNPPYVPAKDKEGMQKNVLDYEPHIALFVAGDDPMIFYRAIASFAKDKVRPGGAIYVEAYENAAKEAANIFSNAGFGDVIIKQDMQGKERMVKASKAY